MTLLREGHILQDGPFWVYTSYKYTSPNFEVVRFCGEGRDGGPEEIVDTYDEQALLDILIKTDSESIEKFVKDPSWGCQCAMCDKRRRAIPTPPKSPP